MENLVEELVGDIYDEYDARPTATQRGGPGLAEIDGLISLGEFRQRTGVLLPKGSYDTVGGLVITHLGHVPAVGDAVELAGHRLTVVSVDGWRVQRVAVTALPASGTEPPGEG